MITETNKRIAKNTLFLYLRMILVMGGTLFTVRIILNALGIIDYGVYNVVGGIAVLFTFLSNTMAHASQRFFSYELGRDDVRNVKSIFGVNMTIYALISIVVLLLAETIGLWFLNAKMVIPPERIEAASWIYQFSILSFIASMFSTPYRAVILAREKMSVFAYISIVEVLVKLIVAYMMIVITFDKLKFYAISQFVITMCISLIYIYVCAKRYEECQFVFKWDKKRLAEIMSYTGWSFYGHASMSLRSQGVNIVLNVFFGPIVNTAQAIAFQINAAITNLYMNFFLAVKPQIIKCYAQNARAEMLNLIYRSSKFCYFLMLILSIPLLLETPYVLQLWLKNVPEYTVLFTRITIVTTMIDSITPALQTSADATGKIRNYQLILGTVILLNIPLCWLGFKLGFPPQSAMYIVMIISVITSFVKIQFAKKMVALSIMYFFKKVFLVIFLVTVISFIMPFFLLFIVNEGFFRLCLITILSTLSCCLSIFYLGLSNNERKFCISFFCKTKSSVIV